jgi:hypothetical protein
MPFLVRRSESLSSYEEADLQPSRASRFGLVSPEPSAEAERSASTKIGPDDGRTRGRAPDDHDQYEKPIPTDPMILDWSPPLNASGVSPSD